MAKLPIGYKFDRFEIVKAKDGHEYEVIHFKIAWWLKVWLILSHLWKRGE